MNPKNILVKYAWGILLGYIGLVTTGLYLFHAYFFGTFAFDIVSFMGLLPLPALVAVGYLYERLVHLKRTLDDKVAERTRELRESEEKYRTLVENISAGIFRLTAGQHPRFVEANRAMMEIFGYADKEEFLAVPPTSLFRSEADAETFFASLREEETLSGRLFKMQRKDGTPLWAHVTARRIDRDGAPASIDGLVEDITRQKKAEQRMMEAFQERETALQKEQALRRAVAHRFINPLCITRGYMDYLILEEDLSPRVKQTIWKMRRAVKRIEHAVTTKLQGSEATEGAAEEQRPTSLPAPPADRGTMAKKVVLLVDADEAIVDMLSQHISSLHDAITTYKALDGEEAITRYRMLHGNDNPPDLVLVDLRFPGSGSTLDGVAVTRTILDVDPDAVIYGYTSWYNTGWGRELREAGARDVIDKTTPLPKLMYKIRGILSG